MKSLDLLSHTFTAPGFGVHTVSSGSEKRKAIAKILFPQAADDAQVVDAWKKSLQNLASHRGIFLYGIPSDSGGGIQRGANWGPLALRERFYANLPAERRSKIFDLGDVRANPQLLLDEYVSDATLRSCRRSMHGDPNSSYAVSPLSIAGDFLKEFHQEHHGKKLFMMGGDHSVSYPAMKEFLKSKKAQGKKVAAIHFDAHTDLNDERLGIPVCFGTWVAHVLPDLADPSLWFQIGIRATAKTREHWAKTKKITQYWAKDVIEKGPSTVTREIIDQLKKHQVDSLYVTFDIDALDIEEAGATGTPEGAGLKTADCIAMIQAFGKEFSIDGADLAEVAPYVNYHGMGKSENEPKNTLKNALAVMNALIDVM